MSVLLAFLALLAEAAVGYPDRLFRAVGHPVTWIGRLIAALDRALNDPAQSPARRKAGGVVALAVIVAASGVPAWA
ncbi:MAG: cobalamin biosynthesis protein, partial [Aquamicrobium sp.]|nr:cobalamin biosynthesis protein [Aquamicrobium sp.]